MDFRIRMVPLQDVSTDPGDLIQESRDSERKNKRDQRDHGNRQRRVKGQCPKPGFVFKQDNDQQMDKIGPEAPVGHFPDEGITLAGRGKTVFEENENGNGFERDIYRVRIIIVLKRLTASE